MSECRCLDKSDLGTFLSAGEEGKWEGRKEDCDGHRGGVKIRTTDR